MSPWGKSATTHIDDTLVFFHYSRPVLSKSIFWSLRDPAPKVVSYKARKTNKRVFLVLVMKKRNYTRIGHSFFRPIRE